MALSFTSPDRNERFAIDQRKAHWGIVRVSLNASDHCPPQPRLGLSDNAQLINADGVFGTHNLEPRMAGAALAISPLAVIFTVFFWSFLWGIPGALIGVPITIALLTLCEHSEATRWIAILLSGKPSPPVQPDK